MSKIMFMEDRVVQDEFAGTVNETRYRRGETLECSEDTATHWISRGVAVDATHMKSQDVKKIAKPPEEEELSSPVTEAAQRIELPSGKK